MKTLQNNLTQQLSESVERLQQQVERVEFWASAVTGFVQPVPEYTPDNTHVDQYLKPGRPPRKRKRRRAANRNDTPDRADAKGSASEERKQGPLSGNLKPASA